ncbi:hypothetical protein PV326_003160 [Microctonus aethiopoides]|nr:hypothetical protein PV326_003160 [Microctonus aethiopoides]
MTKNPSRSHQPIRCAQMRQVLHPTCPTNTEIMKTIWVIGGPGCGKGTQCDKIISKYGLLHLSSGDLLRDEVKSGSSRGAELQELMSKGLFVPTEVVLSLIKENMDKVKEDGAAIKGFLIDGYPREVEQGILFEKMVCPVDLILFFDVSNETMKKRLLSRAAVSQRADDNEETIVKRIEIFNAKNNQIVENYKSKVMRINAEGSIDDIFLEVTKALDTIFSDNNQQLNLIFVEQIRHAHERHFQILMTNRCFKITRKTAPKFKLIRRNSRSTDFILSQKLFSNIEQCQKFARLKNALAFNFYSIDNLKNANINLEDQHNCQVIGCPETHIRNSLVSDEKFSYYSLYSRHKMRVNDTIKCIPRVGLFVKSKEFENYTNAQAECIKIHGKMANVISAERSNELSDYVGDKLTYVGLSNRDKDRLWKNEFDEPLSCFDYRAWDIGEPTSRGCVTLTKLTINSSTSSISFPVWKVMSCSQLLPFICEILPSFN